MTRITNRRALALAAVTAIAWAAPSQAADLQRTMANVVRFADTAQSFAADGFQADEIDTLWRVTTSLTAQIDGLTAQIDGLTAQIDGVADQERLAARSLCNNEVSVSLENTRDGLQKLQDGSLGAPGFLIIVTALRAKAQSCNAV